MVFSLHSTDQETPHRDDVTFMQDLKHMTQTGAQVF